MSRYALCLHGLAFGTSDIGNKVDWSGAFPYFQKNVLRPEVDVFIHTWDKGQSEEWGKLIEAYRPVKAFMEPQKEFPGCPETKSIYSRWYSANRSVSMASPYPENLSYYDGVLLCRYDLVWRTAFPWRTMTPGSPFVTPKWRQKPAPDSGYLDYWFYGDQISMMKMCGLYFNLDGFFKNGIKENGHTVSEAQIKKHRFQVQQWGEQPEDFILLRRLLGAKN